MTELKKPTTDMASIWSMDPSLLLFEEPAIEGTIVLLYDLHWDEGKIPSIALTNPTWRDLWRAADSLIDSVEDDQHVLIEDFIENDDGTWSLITRSWMSL